MAKGFLSYFKGFKIVWTVFRVALNGDAGKLMVLNFPTEEEAQTAYREMYAAELRKLIAKMEEEKK